jgi:Tfp pilus assembly protein PilF
MALLLALTLATASCSKGAADAADPAADAKTASAALDAGLKSHAAGDTATATDQYNTVLKHEPKNKFALYNLALIDAGNGNYGLAEEKYRLTLESDAAYEPALFNLAILRSTKDPKEAISLYERAVAANPKDAAALLNLGLLLRTNGQKAKGDKLVLQAVKMNPKLKDPAK